MVWVGLIFSSATAQTNTLIFQMPSGYGEAFTIDKSTGDFYLGWESFPNGGIRKIGSNGVAVGDISNEFPRALTVDANGNAYYYKANSNDIKKADQSSNISTLLTSSLPQGVAISGNKLFYSEVINGKILYIDLTQTAPYTPTVIYNISGSFPTNLYARGNFVYAITGTGSSGKIIKIDTSNANAITELAINRDSPMFITEDGSGNVYFTDTNTNNNKKRINRINSSGNLTSIYEDTEFRAIDSDSSGNVFYNKGGKIYQLNSDYLSTKNIVTKRFSIFPNPAKDFVTISNVVKGAEVSLFDMSGKLLYSTKATGTTLTINTSSYKNGVYMLKVDGQTTKLLISK